METVYKDGFDVVTDVRALINVPAIVKSVPAVNEYGIVPISIDEPFWISI